MSAEEIEDKLRAGIANEFEVEPERVVTEATLVGDIGLDSLDFVDLVVLVDNLTGVKLTRDELMSISTFGQLVKHIESRQ